MSEKKFTQGEWVVGECLQVLTQGGRTVADAGCSLFPKEEQEVNAHLIAAAPELYESLDLLLSIVINEGWSGTMIKNAEAVLAKARGEVAK